MGSRDAFVVVEQMKRRVARLLQLLLLVASPAGAAASAARHTVVSSPPPPVGPVSAPAQPHIAAGFASSNVFWPGDTDADGTVYQCAYIPTLVLANHTRLIAHGSCGTEANSCNGLHIQRATFAESRLDSDDRGLPRGTPGNPIQEGKICQKHSDNGGATWSKLRVVARGVDTGQIVWDDLRKVLVMQYSTVPKSEACPDCPGGGAVMEFKSTDLGAAPNKRLLSQMHAPLPAQLRLNGGWCVWLGDTWSKPRCLTVSQNGVVHGAPAIAGCGAPMPGAPTGDGGGSIWTSAGAALQLSSGNKHHPHRLVFTGHVNGCQQFWYTDDGETYQFAKNATGGPLCTIGIGEVGFAETPDGGILGSGRNGIFHGPGKCNCRGTVRSSDGGDHFGPLGFDPVLVEPECMVRRGAINQTRHPNICFALGYVCDCVWHSLQRQR